MGYISKEHTALLIIDIINDFEFEGGNELFFHTNRIATNIALLKKRVSNLNIPIIYVNDNFKNWQADFSALTTMTLQEKNKGKPIVELLVPEAGDFHILKPSYSGFYATPLHLLLEHLKIKSLILTGIAGNMCVQFTANDAFMYNYELFVPADCIASQSEEANNIALTQMKDILKANITTSNKLQFI